MQSGAFKLLGGIIVFIAVSCSSDSPADNTSDYVLNQHLKFSQYTSPGDYEYLYKDLPESVDDICDLIKNQLIHPFDAHKFGDRIPEERKFEDRDYPTVSDMLAELVIIS